MSNWKTAFTGDPDRIIKSHSKRFGALKDQLGERGIEVESVIRDLQNFSVQIPSWGVGVGGTRFGRFPQAGMPTTLDEKLDDIAVLDRLVGGSASVVSLHIPWDEPKDPSVLVGAMKER